MNPNLTQIQIHLMQELDSEYGQAGPDMMPFVADSLEEFLKEFLQQELVHSLTSEEKIGMFSRSGRYLQLGEQIYHLEIADDVLREATLNIVLQRHKPDNQLPRSKQLGLAIPGCGAYRRVVLILPEEISAEAEHLASLTETIFQTGYAWLLDYLQRSIKKAEGEFVFALYSRLRRLFSASGRAELAEKVWLVTVTKEKGFYVVDYQQGQAAVSRIQQHPSTLPDSPAKLTGTFLTTIIPWEDMLSRTAIMEKRCIDVELERAKYLSSDTLQVISETIIHGSNFISVQPISVTDEPFLVAVFPTSYRDVIVPMLEEASEDLEEVLRFSRNRILRILHSLQPGVRRSAMIAKVGEFAGGFIRGFLDLGQ